ncbi:hypothetical protein H2198_008683 [Neophaeococcomyces mojaviensis]|uniref:Uncharacterized protein n=1 Tax=Neophaeococcomyces mojaviensis TaxID=3383035 RepID=A0ACC2ZWW8_9EURO|nr:hypothetical protein H2198_008683 [Knufia sp. JES_112]
MPRTLKRRSEAISRDASDSDSEEQQPRSTLNRRQPRRSTPPSDATRSDVENDGSDAGDRAQDLQSQVQIMVKKLVRLALSAEYSRQPIRRTDINAKILKDPASGGNVSARVNFRTVFNGAQKTLRDVFGMEMVDLPSRERTGLADRRKAASQKATQKETQAQRAKHDEIRSGTQSRVRDLVAGAQSWILVSTLPTAYRAHPELFMPQRAPDPATESAYAALYTIIVSLIYLHTPSGTADTQNERARGSGQSQIQQADDTTEPLSDAKLYRWLARLDLDTYAPPPLDMTVEKVLARMIKEGYVEKRRDTSSGEEVVEWVVGPRGKREIGRKGVAGFVRGVYGFGVDGSGSGLQMPEVGGEEEDDGDGEGRERDGERIQPRRPVKMERDELEQRLVRTLGGVVKLDIEGSNANEANGVVEEG